MGAAVSVEVREALERLGPAFVKLGQLISVRPDVFPADLVFELSRLQEDVPPDPPGAISQVIEAEFGLGPERLFERFDPEPIAAGSVAQVHAARTHEGTEAVVKVQRPDAARLMELDLELARRLARWAERSGILRGVDASALVEEFAESVRRELDFRVEARHSDRFAFLFQGDEDVLIPRVLWRRTSGRVLTMERVEGWTLGRQEEARAAGVDVERLARAGARAFMQQVLVYGFFHADLHPANLMLTKDGRIAYLDFGIMGTLTAEERRTVARLLAALTEHRAEDALELSRRLGVVVDPRHREAVVAELSGLLDRFLREDAKVALVQFGRRFLVLLRRYGVRVPRGYGLLVKSLVTVEGVSQTMAPEINLVAAARPVAAALTLRIGLGETLAGRTLMRLARAASSSDTLPVGMPRAGYRGSDDE